MSFSRMASAALLAAALLGEPAQAQAGSAAAKYFFRIADVRSDVGTEESVKAMARAALEKELLARPEFTSDIGGATGNDVFAAELARRRLQAFNVSLRFEELKIEVKPPRPGGRLKQLAINVRLSVFGTTLPGEKLSFTGNGEAGVEAEFIEKRIADETRSLTSDVLGQAIKQAVDQAVAKLSIPKSAPFNESNRKRKKK